MSSHVNKLTTEKNKRALLELVNLPGNDACADCKARYPRWASHNLGIFICMSCASIHRKMGTHISKVKSLTIDSWTKEQVQKMKEVGNTKSNEYHNPHESRNPPPTNMIDSERDSDLEKYIRSKYEFKSFVDRSAFVAARLGPSRSASSVISTSSSLSVSKPPVPPAAAPPDLPPISDLCISTAPPPPSSQSSSLSNAINGKLSTTKTASEGELGDTTTTTNVQTHPNVTVPSLPDNLIMIPLDSDEVCVGEICTRLTEGKKDKRKNTNYLNSNSNNEDGLGTLLPVEKYKPAHELKDGALERAGRASSSGIKTR